MGPRERPISATSNWPPEISEELPYLIDSKSLTEEAVAGAVRALRDQGAQVIVASEAFSVDDPENELRVTALAESEGLYATGGHEISQLYGLKMRTRTAVVNASLIPKMMETANMTETAVRGYPDQVRPDDHAL